MPTLLAAMLESAVQPLLNGRANEQFELLKCFSHAFLAASNACCLARTCRVRQFSGLGLHDTEPREIETTCAAFSRLVAHLLDCLDICLMPAEQVPGAVMAHLIELIPETVQLHLRLQLNEDRRDGLASLAGGLDEVCSHSAHEID
jgi:hypothetical protein